MTIMKNIKNYRTHDFYCLNCGKRNISIMRPRGRMREKGHRKALWCPYCQEYVNHFECFDEEDAWEFKQAFENQEFVEEAQESIQFLRLGRLVFDET